MLAMIPTAAKVVAIPARAAWDPGPGCGVQGSESNRHGGMLAPSLPLLSPPVGWLACREPLDALMARSGWLAGLSRGLEPPPPRAQLSGSLQWTFLSGNPLWDGFEFVNAGPGPADEAESTNRKKSSKRARLSLGHQVPIVLSGSLSTGCFRLAGR
jgi:hypothetical protein